MYGYSGQLTGIVRKTSKEGKQFFQAYLKLGNGPDGKPVMSLANIAFGVNSKGEALVPRAYDQLIDVKGQLRVSQRTVEGKTFDNLWLTLTEITLREPEQDCTSLFSDMLQKRIASREAHASTAVTTEEDPFHPL